MMKRVISGVFLLIALGALGLILAGALTSGEQLIVRFLTAIIVAALALYVISDLRLQADDNAVASGSRGGPTPNPVRIPVGNGNGHDSLPPNSTAAFMATVTGKRSAAPPSVFDKPGSDKTGSDKTASGQAGDAPVAAARWAAPTADPTASYGETHSGETWAERPGAGETGVARSGLTADLDPAAMDAEHRDLPGSLWADRSPDADLDDLLNPYEQDDEEVTRWPLTAEHKAIDVDTLLAPSVGATASASPSAWAGETATATAATTDTTADSDRGPEEGNTNDVGPGDEDNEESFDHLFGGGRPRPVPAGRDHSGPTGIDSPFGRLSAGTALGLLDRPTTSTSANHEGETGSDDPAPAHQARPQQALAPQALSPTIAAAAYARAPMANIVDLRSRRVPVSSEIETAIRNGEIEVIASLMEQGLLTTEGPISDRDVRTMVYVAFTSSELRKILLAGGTLDGDNSDLDLGDVELFDENLPTPQAAIGTGSGTGPAVIDLRDEKPADYGFDLRSTPASARAL